jgi:general secretion pathway protein G
MSTRRRMMRRGFTLIELLLVLVIIVVLAGIVAPKFVGRSEQARKAAARADISRIQLQLDAFEVDAGRFPTTEEGLAALLTPPASVKAWAGPYLNTLPTDPWQNPYVYRFPGQNNVGGYDILSFGPDGTEGGNDDINNWTK